MYSNSSWVCGARKALGLVLKQKYRTGSRRQHQWQKEINTLSDFSYYALTTLLGTQTLGEEYCDLVQVNEGSQTYPLALVLYLIHDIHSQKESIQLNSTQLYFLAPFPTCQYTHPLTLHLHTQHYRNQTTDTISTKFTQRCRNRKDVEDDLHRFHPFASASSPGILHQKRPSYPPRHLLLCWLLL